MEGKQGDVRCCTIRDFVCDDVDSSMSSDTDLESDISKWTDGKREGREYQAV